MLNWMFLFLLAFLQDALPVVQLDVENEEVKIGEVIEGITTVFVFSLTAKEEIDWSEFTTQTSCSCMKVKVKNDAPAVKKAVEVSLWVRPQTQTTSVGQPVLWRLQSEKRGSILVKGTVIAPAVLDYTGIKSKDVVGGSRVFTITAIDRVKLSDIPTSEHNGVQILSKVLDDGKKLEVRLDAKEEPDEGTIFLDIPFALRGTDVTGKLVRSIKIVKPKPCVLSPSRINIGSALSGRFLWRDNRGIEGQPVKFFLVSEQGKVEIPMPEYDSKTATKVVPFVVPKTWLGTMRIRAVDEASTVLAELSLIREGE
jgi:hypothetical protein